MNALDPIAHDGLLYLSAADVERAVGPERALFVEAVEAALRGGSRSILSEADSKRVLGAYGVPTVETRIATTIDEAVRFADELGYPVALKILSPQITHKSDVGGVVLDLADGDFRLDFCHDAADGRDEHGGRHG